MEEVIHEIYKISKEYINNLQKLFDRTNKNFKKNLNKDEVFQREFLKLKNNLIGPIMFSIRMHIADLLSITKNLESDCNLWTTLEKTVKKSLDSYEIEASISMPSFWQIDFSMGINEIFIGNDNQSGLNFGVWTNGKDIYKGEFENFLDNGIEVKAKSGYGLQVFEDGSMFEGEFSANAQLTGKWKLDTGEEFYGLRMRNEGWMIGMKASDFKTGGNCKNHLYYQGKKTILKNVDPRQPIDVKGLKGESDIKQVICWEQGVRFEGYCEEFFPIIGTFFFHNEKLPDFKKQTVINVGGKICVIKSIRPTRLFELRKKRIAKIDFLDGSSFEGGINEHMELTGFGKFKDPRGRCSYGIYQHSCVDLEFDATDIETKRFLDIIPLDYFIDSNKFESNKVNQFIKIPILMIKNKIKGVPIKYKSFGYKGKWKNSKFDDGLCKITVNEILFKAYCHEGVIISVRNLSPKDLFKIYYSETHIDSNQESSRFLSLHFLDGGKYKGLFDVKRMIPKGIGRMICPDGQVLQGYWLSRKSLFVFKKINGRKNDSINVLEKGRHEIKLANGKILEGDFENFKLVDGHLSNGMTKTKFRGFKYYLDCLKSDFRNISFSFIIASDQRSVSRMGEESSGLWECQKKIKERKLFYEYGLINGEKFTGMVLKKGMEAETEVVIRASDLILEKMAKQGRSLSKRRTVYNDMDDNYYSKVLKEGIMYDERGIDLTESMSWKIDIEKFNQLCYFEQNNYQEFNSETKMIGFGKNAEIEYDDDLSKKRPSKSYIQITKSGMFKTHFDLFDYIEVPKKSIYLQDLCEYFKFSPDSVNLDFLQDDKNFKFAIFELNKLNGIAEVTADSIKFYNGNEYAFENGERCFYYSLGTFKEFLGEGKILEQSYYWRNFFVESLINNFEKGFFERELKDKLMADSLTNGGKTKLRFNDDIMLETNWSNFKIIGNSDYQNHTGEKMETAMYSYGSISTKKEANFDTISSLRSTRLLNLYGALIEQISEKVKLFPRQ